MIGGRPLEAETGEKGGPGAVPEIEMIGGTVETGEARNEEAAGSDAQVVTETDRPVRIAAVENHGRPGRTSEGIPSEPRKVERPSGRVAGSPLEGQPPRESCELPHEMDTGSPSARPDRALRNVATAEQWSPTWSTGQTRTGASTRGARNPISERTIGPAGAPPENRVCNAPTSCEKRKEAKNATTYLENSFPRGASDS